MKTIDNALVALCQAQIETGASGEKANVCYTFSDNLSTAKQEERIRG